MSYLNQVLHILKQSPHQHFKLSIPQCEFFRTRGFPGQCWPSVVTSATIQKMTQKTSKQQLWNSFKEFSLPLLKIPPCLMKYMSLFIIFFFCGKRQANTGLFCSESTDPFFLSLRRGSKSCGLIAEPQKLAATQAEALGWTFSLAPAEPSPASELGEPEHLQGVSCLQSSHQFRSLGNTAAFNPSQ